jgi:hypothetical protein
MVFNELLLTSTEGFALTICLLLTLALPDPSARKHKTMQEPRTAAKITLACVLRPAL